MKYGSRLAARRCGGRLFFVVVLGERPGMAAPPVLGALAGQAPSGGPKGRSAWVIVLGARPGIAAPNGAAILGRAAIPDT